jgi:hypothetical protein
MEYGGYRYPKTETAVSKDWQRLELQKVRKAEGVFYMGVELTLDAVKAVEFA